MAKIDVSASTAWTNPVNQQAAYIARTWQGQETKTNSGRAFYFASQSLLAEAILGYEHFEFDGIDNTSYANAIKGALASDVSITSAWSPVTVHGIAALRATGKSVRVDDTNVEVTVAVIGRNAWRTLVFARGRSVDQLPEKDGFVEALFGTAN